jgi:hypothetical protein
MIYTLHRSNFENPVERLTEIRDDISLPNSHPSNGSSAESQMSNAIDGSNNCGLLGVCVQNQMIIQRKALSQVDPRPSMPNGFDQLIDNGDLIGSVSGVGNEKKRSRPYSRSTNESGDITNIT